MSGFGADIVSLVRFLRRRASNDGCTVKPSVRSDFAYRARWLPAFHSKLSGVDDSFGKGLRGFLGQIVPDTAGDSPMFVWARELLRVGARVRVRGAIRIAFERNGGHGNYR